MANALFPFGSGKDCNISGDDLLSDPLYLSQNISYFDKSVSFVRVSVNGYIAMGNDFSSYTPEPLAQHALVAPFFSDVDTRKAGSVFYREEKDPVWLNKAENEVVEAGRSKYFKPTILVIATWDRVGYYNSKSDKRNTFQAVVASSGKETHVLLSYSNICWSSPDNMNGKNGLLMGSDTSKLPILGVGDGQGREHRVCGQIEVTILNLPTKTGNSGKKGLWVFTVSQPEPDQPFAGDIENTDQDDVTTHPDYPLTTLFKAMFTHRFGPEGGSHNSEKLGVLITVPKGASSKPFEVEGRIAFGGPYFVDELYEPISPIYFIKETTPAQTFSKEISFDVEHSANLETEEDYRNVVFVSFSPHLGENNTYAGRIIESDRDPSLATFQISDHAGKLNVKEIKSLHFRLAKKVRVSKNEFKLRKELHWDHDGNHVLVAGSFNNWKPGKILEKRDNGQFSTFVDLPVGTHEYKFIVDGEWKHNPLLPSIPDDKDGFNNVVEVTEASYKMHNKDLTSTEIKRLFRFGASFYNTKIKRGVESLPFSVFTVYSEHTINRTKAENMIKNQLPGKVEPGQWSSNSDLSFTKEDDSAGLTSSALTGWELLQSHMPPKIYIEELLSVTKKLDVRRESDLKNPNFRYPKITNTFRQNEKFNPDRSMKCTFSVSGFNRKIGTDVLLIQESAPMDPSFIERLRTVLMKLSNKDQVYNFGIAIGVNPNQMGKMKPSPGDEPKDELPSPDELKDELISFINRLHLHIQKNSINLEINDDTVDKALRVIGREDLA